jgi:ligand-binding sensor domain-containing protein
MRHLIFSLCFFLFSCQENQGNPVSTAWPPLGETVKSLGNNIMVIYHDSRGMYWFGSWETGLYTFDGKTLRHISQPEGLPGNRVEEIKEDKNGIIYINTNKGLCKVINNELLLIPEAQPNLSRWSLDSNDIWFKSRSSGHVYRYDGIQLYNLKIPAIALEEEYRKITHSQLNPYDVYCNYRDHHGNVWFGTAALGVFRYNGKSFDWITESDVNEIHNGPSNGVRSILEDKDGNFWFNSSYKYLAKDSIPTQGNSFYTRLESIGSLDGKINGVLDEYLSITKDDDNNLWFATYMHGVYKYDGSKISHYAIRENDKNITLFYIYKDRHGEIWLGTHQNGLWKFNGNEFKRFSISE